MSLSRRRFLGGAAPGVLGLLPSCLAARDETTLGVGLVSRIETVDPTALTGLPLIWLADVLRDCGFSVP